MTAHVWWLADGDVGYVTRKAQYAPKTTEHLPSSGGACAYSLPRLMHIGLDKFSSYESS